MNDPQPADPQSPQAAPECRFGLGLAALGRPGYINLGHNQDLQSDYEVDSMQRRAHQVLDCAWGAGVRYFDAARSYGKAEQFLASWLGARKISADSVFVASKWGYTYTADWQVNVAHGQSHEVKQHSIDRLNQQFVESTEQLGSQLDLYQIHSATLDSGVLSNDTVLDRLAELRDQGLQIGLSVSGAEQATVIRKAFECHRAGQPIFSAVQATWNLFEPSAGAALQEASDRGWRVIVKEGVANGRLTTRNEDPEFVSRRKQLQAVADSHSVGIDAVALAVILAQPWSNVVLSGAATGEHLLSNLEAIEVAENLEPDVADSLIDSLAVSPADYWSKRSGLRWN
jgi:aryl-alcohol dehydrogenase-like predicted oxidoreductase